MLWFSGGTCNPKLNRPEQCRWMHSHLLRLCKKRSCTGCSPHTAVSLSPKKGPHSDGYLADTLPELRPFKCSSVCDVCISLCKESATAAFLKPQLQACLGQPCWQPVRATCGSHHMPAST